MNELAVITNKPIVSVEEALEQRQSLMKYIDNLLVEGVDYGSVPGTDRDVLLKPGAEKLASFLGLTPDFIEMGVTEDWTGQDHGGEPFFSYRYKCNLYKGDFKVGQGIGSCNSWEKKYRWRWVDEGELPPTVNPDHLLTRQATVQEFQFAINKAETTGQYGKPQIYWDEFKAAIKAGEANKFTKTTQSGKELPAWAITTTLYRVPNEDIFSQVNTLDKMSQKRCLGTTTPVLIKTNKGIFRGEIKTAWEIYNKGSDVWLPGIDGTWRKVQGMVKQSGKQVVRIDLADGSYILATKEHRFPTLNGLKSVEKLKVGDRLLRSDLTGVMGNDGALPDFGWIVGLFLAEGSFVSESNTTRFTLHENETEYIDKIKAVAKIFGAKIGIISKEGKAIQVDVYGAAFRGLISQFCTGRHSYGKHLSKFAWRQGLEFLDAVLEGYLAGDGSWTDNNGRGPYWRIGFTGKNRALATDLRCLCSILGYRVKIVRRSARARGIEFPTFEGWIKPPTSKPSYNTICLEEIVEITEQNRPATVVDIEVDGDHLFCLANGIQTHNSLVAAILVAASVSELFTQDLEDLTPTAIVEVVAKVDTKAEYVEAEIISPPAPPSEEETQAFPNSPDAILELLNKIGKINGFYSDTNAIVDSLIHISTDAFPPSNDKDGWRNIFILLRDYALMRINQEQKETEIPF